MNRFRVSQFNMQFGQIWDDAYPDRAPIRLDATLQELQRHEADLIILQEVERASPGGVQATVPPNFTWLRQQLAGYDSWFSYPKADPRELPFGIGLAIFSRTPLRERVRRPLAGVRVNASRSLAVQRVAAPFSRAATGTQPNFFLRARRRRRRKRRPSFPPSL